MKFFQLFRLTGVANSTVFDTGLKSTTAEKKRLIAVHTQLDKYAGTDDNQIQGWLEKVKVYDFPEKLFGTELVTNVAQTADGGKMHAVPVEADIQAGDTFKAAIQCAATAVNVRGAYEYEIIA
jgi:hypothetical protein